MNSNPLAEVFGFPISNQSKKANNFRINKLCPFSNIVPNCTKDKAQDPLGVCSILHNGECVITCPVRFREDWSIIEDAARFAFPPEAKWTSLSEVKLNDIDGKPAGNIDYVIVRLDDDGSVIDFVSVEVQGVYISGNLRNAFKNYIKNPYPDFKWDGENYPHPDYLSSSRKRLIPQMLSKGGIFKSWGKKQCIVIQEEFFSTLPEIPVCTEAKADIAWFLYRLDHDKHTDTYHLALSRTVYTEYDSALNTVISPRPGDIDVFLGTLQKKLATRKPISVSPDNPQTILESPNDINE